MEPKTQSDEQNWNCPNKGNNNQPNTHYCENWFFPTLYNPAVCVKLSHLFSQDVVTVNEEETGDPLHNHEDDCEGYSESPRC